jgi:hypothetical protein
MEIAGEVDGVDGGVDERRVGDLVPEQEVELGQEGPLQASVAVADRRQAVERHALPAVIRFGHEQPVQVLRGRWAPGGHRERGDAGPVSSLMGARILRRRHQQGSITCGTRLGEVVERRLRRAR